MALAPCAECGKEISDQADECPHCGHPDLVGTKERDRKAEEAAALGAPRGTLWSFGFIVIAAVVFFSMDQFDLPWWNIFSLPVVWAGYDELMSRLYSERARVDD